VNLFDLANTLTLKDPIEEIASFLRRSRGEVREKIAELKAIEHIRSEMAGVTLEPEERKRWLVERGIEIISEASRRLGDELKARHPEIPWPKVAGIGNILRHEYEGISAPVMWKLVQDDLISLEQVCREELARSRREGLHELDLVHQQRWDLIVSVTRISWPSNLLPRHPDRHAGDVRAGRGAVALYRRGQTGLGRVVSIH
jgi:uncharacterized protein with HEPN domain